MPAKSPVEPRGGKLLRRDFERLETLGLHSAVLIRVTDCESLGLHSAVLLHVTDCQKAALLEHAEKGLCLELMAVAHVSVEQLFFSLSL